jgi:branched-chain amino acid transport system permease protein/neutral amino acid transport system permease protein
MLVVSAIGFGIITASILALGAVGFTVQFGVTNVFNLAYGDVMTASAFTAYVANRLGLGSWWGLVFGAIFGAIASYALNRLLYTPFIRRGSKLFVMIIVTIAVSLILQNVMQAIWGSGFFSLHISSGSTFHVLGKAMRATAADPELARNCGVRTRLVTDCAWLVSGALCGISGVALVAELGSFQSTTGGAFLVPIVASAAVGGIGHSYGAMLGALVIGLSSELAAVVFAPQYKDVVAFLLLIVVLLVRPQGILSEVATDKAVAA